MEYICMMAVIAGGISTMLYLPYMLVNKLFKETELKYIEQKLAGR